MSSGSKKRNPDMHFLFLSVNAPIPGSLTGPLWRELLIYRAFFTYLSKALGKECSSMFSKSEDRMETGNNFQSLT
jgi:hypothetical protein